MQTLTALIVFGFTYLGMAAGRLPWLRVDRTGIALLGVTALLATDTTTLDQIAAKTDTPSLVLLFALMMIPAQFAEAGFFEHCAARIGRAGGSPVRLLALTVAITGALSAVLANDILLLALVPPLIVVLRARGLDPRPFLIAVAGAANAGSAATLIGNPQTILIGEVGGVGFLGYLGAGGVPAAFALGAVFLQVALVWRRRIALPEGPAETAEIEHHPFDRAQVIKGVVATVALVGLCLTSLPREVGALVIAALLLANRQFTSRRMIAEVDWPLLLLVACLSGVTGAVADTGLPGRAISALEEMGLLPDSLLVLAPLSIVTSNTIGSLPAVVLLLQMWPGAPQGALIGLALLTSLASNLLLVGSLSTVIVVERAAALGVRLSFREFARVGLPATLVSMAFAIAWLALTGWTEPFPDGTGDVPLRD